jgi:hypothetical protein
MCDYSLHGLPSRLAVQGEELVARRFCTSTIGLASPAELGRFIGSASDRKGHWWSLISAETLPQVASEAPAVCVPPGAQLRLSDIGLILQSELGAGPIETVIIHANRCRVRHVSRRGTVCEQTADSAASTPSTQGGSARPGTSARLW